jgi:hypothetical protein
VVGCKYIFICTRANALVNFFVADNNLKEDALGTAKIVKFFDKVFDSVNGGTLRPSCGKPLRGGVWKNSDHLNFWKEAIKTLKNMYFVDKGGKKTIPPSLKNWIVTLEGFLDLNEKLIESGTYIMHSRSFWDRVGYDFFFPCWTN